jgi:NADH:ubiquinone oxidoreductase subunit K
VSLIHFQLLSAALFSIGVYGVLARRSAVMVLLALEMMLNAVNINLIAYGAYGEQGQATGQVIAIFVITVAAAEVGLAMAIILRLFRDRASVDVGEVDLMKW